ncbi:MAG: hypothetical protein ACRYFY_18355 [Janthinobacterium lividum]
MKKVLSFAPGHCPKFGNYRTVLLAAAIGMTFTGKAIAQQSANVYSNVTDPAAVIDGLKAINQYLTPISPSAAIVHCDVMIEHYVAKIETVYGGICQVANKKYVKVCGDTADGWFDLSEWDAPVTPQSRSALVDFTNRSCPGGG